MVVLLRNTGDANSIDVRYQTFVGRNDSDLKLVYEWFICKPIKEDNWYDLILKSGNIFGNAGIAKSLEEATRKLYARSWLDCITLNSKEFKDETENKNKFQITSDSFIEVLAKYQMTAYRISGCLSPLHREYR